MLNQAYAQIVRTARTLANARVRGGKACGDSFIAADKECHAGEGDKLGVDVPETARMAAVTFKAKDASGTQRVFMVVASKNTRAGARFAYEQNPEAVLAEHQKTFTIPEMEKTFRATLLEVVDEIPKAMFHNSYDSIKDAASRGFDEMLHFAKQVKNLVGGVTERDVQLRNRGKFSFDELMAACDGPVALANSGQPCGESFNNSAEFEKSQNKPSKDMIEEAARGLAWRREHNRGGTEVGVARARDISNESNLSDDTVKRMHSFFARHEVDKKGQGFTPNEDGFPSAGRIAWALWGGDAGQTWAAARVSRMVT